MLLNCWFWRDLWGVEMGVIVTCAQALQILTSRAGEIAPTVDLPRISQLQRSW